VTIEIYLLNTNLENIRHVFL